MRVLQAFLVCLFAVACGPTARVTTGPTPTSSASGAPSAEPTLSTHTAGPTGSVTPIPLSTDTPGPGPTTPGATTLPTVPPGTGFRPLSAFATTAAFVVADVAVTPNGFIAVGDGGLDGDDFFGLRQGYVWTSADGVNWSESVDASLRNVSPQQVVMRGADYFMAGYLSACPQLSEEDCTDVPESGNAFWHSTDGIAWQMLPQLVDMQYGRIDDLVVMADRLVVFGGSADENETSTVWQSPDGATWTTSTNLPGLPEISAMTYGNNLLAAFGTLYVPDLDDGVITAATSADGATFVPAAVPELVGAVIEDVVHGTNGFVGVGYESTEALESVGLALFSADGTNWTEATNSDGTWPAAGLELAVALPSGGYVAVGSRLQEDDFTMRDGEAWRSSDGADWTALAKLDGAFSETTTARLGGPGMVVFAVEYHEDDEGNVTSIIHGWFAPLSELGA